MARARAVPQLNPKPQTPNPTPLTRTAAIAGGVELAGADVDVDDCCEVDEGSAQGKGEEDGEDGCIHVGAGV